MCLFPRIDDIALPLLLLLFSPMVWVASVVVIHLRPQLTVVLRKWNHVVTQDRTDTVSCAALLLL